MVNNPPKIFLDIWEYTIFSGVIHQLVIPAGNLRNLIIYIYIYWWNLVAFEYGWFSVSMLNYQKVVPPKNVPTCWATLWLFNIAKDPSFMRFMMFYHLKMLIAHSYVKLSDCKSYYIPQNSKILIIPMIFPFWIFSPKTTVSVGLRWLRTPWPFLSVILQGRLCRDAHGILQVRFLSHGR